MLPSLSLNRCETCFDAAFSNGRTLAYLAGGTPVDGGDGCVSSICGIGSGMNSLLTMIDPTCWCSAGCDPVPVWTTPANDNAPWYDPLKPESARFLGVIITKVTGMDGTLSRSPKSGMGFGNKGSIGALQTKIRELGFEAMMFACDECAMEFGMRWLINKLSGPCQEGCQSCDISVRTCCPGPDEPADTGEWLLQDAGITDGPHWGDFPLRGAECLIRTVNWTMASRSPYLFKCPEVCLEETPMYLSDYLGDGTTPNNPPCPPTFNDWYSGCRVLCCSLNNKYEIGQTAAIMKISTGSRPATNVFITAQVDRFGLNCPPVLPTPDCNGPNCISGVDNCVELKITEIPAYSTFVWDSVRKQVYLEQNGGLTTSPAFNRVQMPDGEPFSWLQTSCRFLCLCVAVPRQCAIKYGEQETSGDPYVSVSIETTHFEL